MRTLVAALGAKIKEPSVLSLDGAQIGQRLFYSGWPLFLIFLEPLIFHRYTLRKPTLSPGVRTVCKYVKAIRLDLYKLVGLGAICDASLGVSLIWFSTLKALEAMLENPCHCRLSSVYFFVFACARRTHDLYECQSPRVACEGCRWCSV